MNIFVKIVPFWECDCVTYYTIHIEGKEKDETTEFMDKYENHEKFKDDLTEIFLYLETWGEDGISHGDRRKLRPENKARAIPPRGVGQNMVRLYCYLIRDNIMILGNGGHKVQPSDRHQDSPFLKPHFDFFNRVANALDKMIIEKELWVEGMELKGDMDLWLK